MARTRFRNSVAAVCTLAVAVSVPALAPRAAEASDFSFHITYRAYLSGLRVGSGDLFGKFDGSEYRLNGAGAVDGIARLFSRYEGTAAAQGSLPDGGTSYQAEFSGDGKKSGVRMRLAGKDVSEVRIDPKPEPHELNNPHRVPVEDNHRRNIVDPLRAVLTPGAFDGGTFDRTACERVLPVFTGRERVDIVLTYREIRTVTASSRHGYSGPALVCDARYRPVAGHRDNNRGVAYVRDSSRIELILAPVPGSDLLVPDRVTVTTPFGPAVVQAHNFHTSGEFNSRFAQAQ